MDQPKIECPSPVPPPPSNSVDATENGPEHVRDDRQAGDLLRAEDGDGGTGKPLPISSNGEDGQPTEAVNEASASRLHAASLWLPILETLLGAIVPAFITGLFIGLGNVIFFFGLFVLLPTAARHGLRFFTLRYRVTGKELVIQSGLIFRRERRIPFDRVQEIELHQGIFHRALDLVKLTITTAGSDAQEASLNVLARPAAESLKETIASQQRGASPQLDSVAAETADLGRCICQLSLRELVLGGVTSKLVASFGAVAAAIVYFQLFLGIGGHVFGKIEKDVVGKMEEKLPGGEPFELEKHVGVRLPDWGPLDFVVDLVFNDTLTKSISLALLGLIVSIVTYVIRYHGFRLTLNGDLLTMSHGLLTFRRGSLSRDRIQALKLEESLLRRWFGLATLRVDSAGDRNQVDESKKREVLVPVASKKVAEDIAKQAIPGLKDLEPNWRPISRRAIMRGSKKGWLLMFVVMVQTYVAAGWLFLIWLPALPFVYFLNYQWFRHTGYWLDEDHFLSRKGWLNRATVCLPIKNIQNVSVSQNVFDRRLELATLSIDTAGQTNTGGGPLIRHLPVAEARNIQQALIDRVAEREFNW